MDKNYVPDKENLVEVNDLKMYFPVKTGLFTRIMDGFRVYQKVKTDNLEVVCYALELLRNAESSTAVVTLKDGAKFLSQLTDGESEEERCLSLNDSKNCVHMANLHKVKGLEAPIVILAGASDLCSLRGRSRHEHRNT